MPAAKQAGEPELGVSEAEVSAIIPTLGRLPQLEDCLASLVRCRPRAREVLVVDQSGASKIRALVEHHGADGARYLHCGQRNKSRAANLGMMEATYETVMLTDDDCTVERSWIGEALGALQGRPFAIATGQVRPGHDSSNVPSTITHDKPREHRGKHNRGVLYGANMAGRRSALLGIGGFDERLDISAEDNDLCYRWLGAGGVIRYEPRMVVWHHDWRSPEEMERLYVRYAKGDAMFYVKHLRMGDLGVVPFLAQDLRQGARAEWSALRRHKPRSHDRKLGILRGLPSGIASGWQVFKR